MLPEKEPEPERKAILLKTPAILHDGDFEKLADSKRWETIVCSPAKIPRGTRRGVFVFVEGTRRRYLERGGKLYRIVAVVRAKQTRRVEPTASKTPIVTLEGIAEIPRDGKISAKLLHWS